MYVLVRADLVPGRQLAQAVHAAIGLAERGSPAGGGSPVDSVGLPETVVVLAVPDEAALIERAGDGYLFHEPDLAGQATAYAAVSDGASFSDLRLALGGAMV